MFKCKSKISGNIYNLNKRFIQGAWLAASTICCQNMYNRTERTNNISVLGGVLLAGANANRITILSIHPTSGILIAGTNVNTVT